MKVTIHKPADFISMRQAGKLAAQTLDYITDFVKAGNSTLDLNNLCHEFILAHDAIPAPLNYKGFPKSICTSVNHVVCHGIPDERKLKDGDILNIDVTVITKEGWYGDTSRMYVVGETSIKAKKLIKTTYDAMMLGIAQIKPGAMIGEIGYTIQKYAESALYSVVRDYCGHGIGKVFHDDPNVFHYGDKNQGPMLKEGMFFTVEPMLNIGKCYTKVKPDGWTVVTKDLSLSAQFEHTIGVTKDGYEIFTLSPAGFTLPPY